MTLLLPAVIEPPRPAFRRFVGVRRVIASGPVMAIEPRLGSVPDYVWCCDALDLLRSLPDGSIDMALTSPPYDKLRRYNGYSWDFEGIARETYRALKPGGVLVWVVGDSVVDGSETLTSFKQAIYFKEAVGFRLHDTMVYYKPGIVFPDPTRYGQTFEYMFIFSKGAPETRNLLSQPSAYAGQRKVGSYRDDGVELVVKSERHVKDSAVMPNVWRIDSGYMKTTPDKFAYQHPAMFPEELARRHIATWSNPGDTVLDYFMGSGTTAKMARVLGRRFIGCDLSPQYVEIARARLDAPYTLPLPLLAEPTAAAVQGELL